MSCSREQVIEAIQRLANGKPLVNVCREMGVPRSTLYYVINNDSDLLDMLARAREEYAEARVCEMQEIAETVEDVGRARLMCDNIKWEAARMAPKKYGDKIQNEHTGKDGGPIEQAVTISVTFHEPG